MKLHRNYITPFISLMFLVVGLSGLLMLFHLFDGYTEVVHEILGLFFLICAIFHIILNWKALKIHFKKGVFLPALFGVFALATILIISERMYPPVDLQIMEKIMNAPVEDAFKALDIEYKEAESKLIKKGILLEKVHIFQDLWLQNNHDAEDIIDLLLE